MPTRLTSGRAPQSNHYAAVSSRRFRGARQIPSSKIIIVVVLILANLSILAYMLFAKRKSSGVAQATSETGGEIKVLPASAITDDNGTKHLLTDLLGNVVMIQFTNPEAINQVDAISKVLSSFTTGELSVVLITRDAQELRTHLPRLSKNTWIVEKDYADLKRVFHVPDCCEKRFIFNAEGKLGYEDYFYETDLTPRLNALVKKRLPPWSEAVHRSLVSLKDPEFLSLLEQSKQSNAKPAVVVLFRSIATACASGELVKTINSNILNGSSARFLAILPSEFSDRDLENLKTNLLVRFPIARANKEFSEELSTLVSEYGESTVNNSILFIVDGKVTVLENSEELSSKLNRL